MDDGLTPALRARLLGIQMLASGHSRTRSCLLFINNTQRMVGVFWMDYNGYQVHYRTLRPGMGIEVDTYLTHPWIFRDMTTGERMHAFHNDVYFPELHRVETNPPDAQRISCRREVNIHFPLNSLRTRCLWTLASFFSEKRMRPTVVQDLPYILRRDLKKIQAIMFKHYQHLRKASLCR